MTTHNVAPACPTTFSDTLHDFLALCFTRDPAARPSARALAAHAFLGEKPGEEDELNSSFSELEAHHEVFAKIERLAEAEDSQVDSLDKGLQTRSKSEPERRAPPSKQQRANKPNPYPYADPYSGECVGG